MADFESLFGPSPSPIVDYFEQDWSAEPWRLGGTIGLDGSDRALLNAERADVLKTDVERVVYSVVGLILVAVAVALAERVFGRYTPVAGTMTDDGITGADHCHAVAGEVGPGSEPADRRVGRCCDRLTLPRAVR